MPDVTGDRYPPWRVEGSTPPPAAWAYVVEQLTHPDRVREWGIAAGAYVARHRRLGAVGPSFREMFEALLPDIRGLPGQYPVEFDADERAAVASRFRMHVAGIWRAEGMIRWREGHAHTLRTGPRFRAQSEAKKAAIRATVIRAEAPA